MFSRTLVFTTLVAIFGASSVSAADPVITVPDSISQCKQATFSWEGITGPADVYVFTGCDDETDTPIAEFADVTGNSVKWNVTVPGGQDLFVQVTDATGADFFSKDFKVTGDPTKADGCIASVAAVYSATATTVPANTANGVPATLSTSKSIAAPVNAVADKTTAAKSTETADTTGQTNGALSTIARPFELFMGAMAVAGAILL